ncbi:MAG: hypothetical protein GC189_00255 [Alphaproteobacteria bacterium]|nr:hypothetical protein [Alphaproteobacteria bacterium]
MALVGVAVMSVTACASRRGGDEGRMDAARRGVADAATSPLRDVGLIRPDIPPVLARLNYPYVSTTLLGGCPAVLYEIGQLDAVLGRESYQPGEDESWAERGADSAQDAALSAVRDTTSDVVPFRSWVRRLSGATRAEREAQRAVELGEMRRSFLRGYGAALGCRGVVPAPPPPQEERRRNRDDDDDRRPQQQGTATPP